jgi:dephospho-CoA kinase
MLKLCKVAVTGGLSCGKSSVCRIFKQLGAQVVSADEIVHQLLTPNTNLGQKVVELLGKDILGKEGFDRSKIAEKVFNDSKLLQSLENILHPAVKEEINRYYQNAQTRGDVPLFIVEIPLLFEVGAEDDFDKVIAVMASSENCRERFTRQHGPQEDYDKRMTRQMDPLLKAKRADYVIVNNGSLDELKQNVKELYETVLKSNQMT